MNRSIINRDFVCGLCTLAIALVYYIGATDIPLSELADAVGPGGMPQSYAWILGGLSLLLMAYSFLGGRAVANVKASNAKAAMATSDTKPSQSAGRREVLRAAGMLAIGAVYVLALPWIGYPLGIGFLVGATVLYQGGKVGWNWLAISAGAAVMFWVIFVLILHIPEPVGLWHALKL
jgi:putative tricarboxylic transport membrane protein